MLARRDVIADAARRFAPPKRYWAVVGNGANSVAAEEVRIKLSELCYKSIACDVTEDKKHIDLSSEPLILVCAAGLVGGTADDVAKEVAIYRAHKATPIVIATEGDERFAAAAAVSAVPAVDPALAFVLSAMAGHLFGYEAALAIDASARPLREAREVIEHALVDVRRRRRRARARCAAGIEPHAERFVDGLRTGCYDGHLEATTAVRLSALLARPARRPAARGVPAGDRQGRHAGRAGRRPHGGADPGDRGADPAGRRHQAPGQDGHRRHLPQRRGLLDRAARAGRCSPPAPAATRLSYRTLKVLADLDPAVAAVTGFTRYRIDGDPAGDAQICDRRPRRHLHGSAEPGRAQPAAGRHQAPRRRRARGAGGPRAAATAAR